MIRGEIDHLLFQDESSIRDYQSLVNNWFPKGKQRIIPTYGNNKSVKLIGILNYETGHVYVQEEERYTAEIFLKFLNNVLKLPEKTAEQEASRLLAVMSEEVYAGMERYFLLRKSENKRFLSGELIGTLK